MCFARVGFPAKLYSLLGNHLVLAQYHLLQANAIINPRTQICTKNATEQKLPPRGKHYNQIFVA